MDIPAGRVLPDKIRKRARLRLGRINLPLCGVDHLYGPGDIAGELRKHLNPLRIPKSLPRIRAVHRAPVIRGDDHHFHGIHRGKKLVCQTLSGSAQPPGTGNIYQTALYCLLDKEFYIQGRHPWDRPMFCLEALFVTVQAATKLEAFCAAFRALQPTPLRGRELQLPFTDSGYRKRLP